MEWMMFLGYVHQLYGPYYRWAIIEMGGQDFSEGEVRNRRVWGRRMVYLLTNAVQGLGCVPPALGKASPRSG